MLESVKLKIKNIVENTAVAMNCTATVEFNDLYPPTVNHKTETENVVRVATKVMGPEHVSTQGLPVTGSEDFSFYL